MDLPRKIEDLPLPSEADQCFQARLNRGAFGFEPGNVKGLPDELVIDFDVGSHHPTFVYHLLRTYTHIDRSERLQGFLECPP
jgi:hypothetical protein